jgi:hypothetical protein
MLLFISIEVFAATIQPITCNAIRDNFPADGVPDQLAPFAVDYVCNYGYVPTRTQESRAFAEFNISSLVEPFSGANLYFRATCYNGCHLPAQSIDFYTYRGDGQITLSDWYAQGTPTGTIGPIPGYTDYNNRIFQIDYAMDITSQLQAARQAGWTHLGIYFRNPSVTYLYQSDPLGFSSLIQVSYFKIETIPEPATLSLLALGGLALLRKRK